MNGLLVLVRHGESEWNAKNIWTGLTDIGLTHIGREEAKRAGEKLKDIAFYAAFSSPLVRAKETRDIILDTLGQSPALYENAALNERDYGVYTGKNKLEINKSLGDGEFLKLRRSWNYPIPQGESLKAVYERVIPYFQKTLLPLLQEGKNILVAAHGNSLRALIKYLDQVSDEDIAMVEMATGEIIVYRIDHSGKVQSQEKRVV